MFSLPASSQTLASLNSNLTNMYRFGGPILIVVGTVSSVLSIVLFVRKNFHQYPSSIYVVARNISNLFFIYFSILYETLSLGYHITTSSSDLVYCRFSNYTALLFDILNPFYLLLTLIDRLLATSFHVSTRARSTHRLAYLLSIGGFLFWVLLHMHTIFYAEIVRIGSSFAYCYFQVGPYSTFITTYSLVIKGVIAPILFVSLGWRIIANYRNRCRLVSISSVTINENTSSALLQSKDREIVLVLIKDIVIYIIFSSISSIIFIYELVTEHQVKDVERKQMEYYIRYMGIFCVGMPFCIGFYTNLFISETFRREVKDLVCCHREQR